jgi:RNA polymerase sigma factor (TIGR02999 family)
MQHAPFVPTISPLNCGRSGMSGVADTSELIRRVNSGEPGAQDALFAATYGELRKLARSRLRDGGRNTVLDTTALVHESYLRFLGAGQLRSDDRRAFFAYASRVMRSVIIDAVRQRQAERRGGDLQRMTLNTQGIDNLPAGEQELLQVHEALEVLAAAEPRLAKVVEMRYFGGYSEQEIADALELNERTVRRDWDKARLLLSAMLNG